MDLDYNNMDLNYTTMDHDYAMELDCAYALTSWRKFKIKWIM